MRYAKLLGLSLVAVFAVGAVAVASASAVLPEFEGPFPNGFTAKELGVGKVETVAGRTVECGEAETSGSINAPKDALVKAILFKKCKSTAFGAGNCQTAGHAEGDVTTTALLALLGYITKPKVGLLFEPESGVNFATFVCKTILGNENLTVKGTVICELTPVNTKGKSFVLTCKQTKGVQSPTSFEGGPKDTLMMEGSGPENFAFEQFGGESLSDITTERETQIKA